MPISSICISEHLGKTNLVALIGSYDNKFKIVEGEKLVETMAFSSTPTSIYTYKISSYDINPNNFIFGTLQGSHGLLVLDKDKETKKLWEVNNDMNLSEIVSAHIYDINLDGTNEIIFIRSNGMVEIYSIGNTLMDNCLLGNFSTHEILTGIDVGRFKNESELEIMLSSYSGLLFSLTPELNLGENNKKPLDKKAFAVYIFIKELIEEPLGSRVSGIKLTGYTEKEKGGVH